MKIGISLLSAGSRKTGVETVVSNLIMQLGKMEGNDQYVIYANTRNLPWLSDVSGQIRVIDVRLSYNWAPWIWEHLFFLVSQRPKEVDVVHFPIGVGVVGYRGKFVLTIHDLILYSHRELVRLRRHLLWRMLYKVNVKKATKIIAVSEHVKGYILREFPIPPDCIRVIYPSAGRRFARCSGTKVFRDKHGLPERYVLFVGTTGRNKNIRRAIDAVKLVRESHSLDHQFIIAGLPGDEDAALKSYVSSNHLWDTVRFLGYIDDDDLPQLYANSALFLFPSLMEGFGVPPLEAMRCGIPVVAAETSCMPEVLGNAAIWVNPLSVESIAEGVARGLLDEDVRQTAIERGLLRAEQFCWEKMAMETVNVYRQAADCE